MTRIEDNDTATQGTHKCFRCAGTGNFITGFVNGKPVGKGTCFRCRGKGKHTADDRRRNRYFDTHRPVY